MSTSQPERRSRWLLGVLVLIWGASWPVIKIGVTAVPPIWFACLRYVVGTACLVVIVALRGELTLPSRSDWKLVAVRRPANGYVLRAHCAGVDTSSAWALVGTRLFDAALGRATFSMVVG
jgi:drug/metabolite transporter (DMT)-like permease